MNARTTQVYKSACRMCHGGCGVLVHVVDGVVQKVTGDPDSPLNKGELCPKGAASIDIIYHQDRLQYPMKRLGARGEGRWARIGWGEAYDIMADKCKAALKAGGPRNIAMYGSGQWTIWEGYAAAKLWKAGFRSNNLDPNASHCMASAVTGFMRTFGIDEPMGCY